MRSAFPRALPSLPSNGTGCKRKGAAQQRPLSSLEIMGRRSATACTPTVGVPATPARAPRYEASSPARPAFPRCRPGRFPAQCADAGSMSAPTARVPAAAQAPDADACAPHPAHEQSLDLIWSLRPAIVALPRIYSPIHVTYPDFTPLPRNSPHQSRLQPGPGAGSASSSLRFPTAVSAFAASGDPR